MSKSADTRGSSRDADDFTRSFTGLVVGVLLAGEGTIVFFLFGILVLMVLGRVGRLPSAGPLAVLAAYVIVPGVMAVAGYALLFRKKWALYVGVAAQLAALAWVGYELFFSHPGPYTESADRAFIPYVAGLAVVAIVLLALPGTRKNLV